MSDPQQELSRSSGSHKGHVVVESVAMSYGLGPEAKEVISQCCIDIAPGLLTVIIGPSGCGKSTLLKLIAGFEKPTSGTITVDGKAVSGPAHDRLVLFQETALFPWMTTYENIMFGPHARGEDSPRTRELAAALIDKVGLTAFRDKYPPQLSGGMQRRAELARALVNNPDLMLLDEPFRGLDAMTKTLMQEYFLALYEENRRTVLFFSTDIDEAIFLADRLLVMSNIPMCVRGDIMIDLPRPRRIVQTLVDPRANEIKMQALSILHEEAMKSFASGSKAAADLLDAFARRIG